MNMYTIPQWILFFYIYCFFGWVWESAYVSICKRKLVNRGFLKGPFLPLYGSGAVCILAATIPVRDNIPAMFVVGMAAATALEYVTGVVMERLFRVRYWDYTGKFLNVNGHICLASTLCWGVMTVLVVKVIHVRIEELVFLLDQRYVRAIVFAITPFIAADFATSFNAAMHLRDVLVRNERLKAEIGRLIEKKEELEQALSATGEKAKGQIGQEMQELLLKIGELKGKITSVKRDSIRGLLKRNPAAVSFKYRETFAELKQNVMEKIEEVRKGPEAN